MPPRTSGRAKLSPWSDRPDRGKLDVRLAGPGDVVTPVADLKAVEAHLNGAGIPCASVTREMAELAKDRVPRTVNQVVWDTPLGPYYHLNARTPSALRRNMWDPQWSAPYTEEWWLEMCINPEDLPKFEVGSRVTFDAMSPEGAPLSVPSARARLLGYDVKAKTLGAWHDYMVEAGREGHGGEIEDVHSTADGRKIYTVRVGGAGLLDSHEFVTGFFFMELWDALDRAAGRWAAAAAPGLTMHDAGHTVEN